MQAVPVKPQLNEQIPPNGTKDGKLDLQLKPRRIPYGRWGPVHSVWTQDARATAKKDTTHAN